jgi:hypothetical protein
MIRSAERPGVVAIGNSHLEALWNASRGGGVPVDVKCLRFMTPAYTPHWTTIDGTKHANRRYLDDARDLIRSEKPTAVVCFAASNLSFDVGSANRPRPFDFVLPSRQELPLCADEIVPYDMMMERAMAAEAEWSEFVAIGVNSGVPVWSVAPPAPLVSFDLFLPRMTHQIKDIITTRGVAPAPFRHKMWLLQVEADRRVAASAGAGFLEVPPASVNDVGLRPVEYAGDALHGNAAYGSLVLQQIADIIEGDRHAPV